jgi:hypothetical protein
MKPSTSILIITVTLAVLSLFQLLLVAGLPLGRAAWGGGNEVLPAGYRIASAGSIVIYGLMLWVARRRISKPDNKGFFIGAWIIFGYSCIGVILNSITSSPVEHVWVPVNLILAWLFFLLARGRRPKVVPALSK